jgi:hypothetical protein
MLIPFFLSRFSIFFQKKILPPVSTAGWAGLSTVTPVFADHLLRPLLTPSSFLTEVFHVAGDGTPSGVVLNEMVARENTEADVAERACRAALYGRTCPVARECGGLSPDIAGLGVAAGAGDGAAAILGRRNNEIGECGNAKVRDYHAAWYAWDRITAVFVGPKDDAGTWATIENVARMASLHAADAGSGGRVEDGPRADRPARTHPSFAGFAGHALANETRDVPFPSADAAMGSVSLCFLGPPLAPHDAELHAAVDLLLRYLTDTSSAPLTQAFVERRGRQLASSVDYWTIEHDPVGIVLGFRGVERGRGGGGGSDGGDGESGTGSGSGSDGEGGGDGDGDGNGENSGSGEDGSEDPLAAVDLFADDVYRDLVMCELRRMTDSGKLHGGLAAMIEVIDRRIIKHLEDTEEDAFEWGIFF